MTTPLYNIINWRSDNEDNAGEAKLVKIINSNAILLSPTDDGGLEKLLKPFFNNTEDNDNNGKIFQTSAGIGTIPLSSHFVTLISQSDTNNPGSIREIIGQDIEYILEGYEINTLDEALDQAAQILLQSRDTVIRGIVSVLRYPYTNTGTIESPINTLLRAGMSVILNNIPGGIAQDSSDNAIDKDAIVTKITYVEGSGAQHSEIELLVDNEGIGISLPPNLLSELSKNSEVGRFQSEAAIGARGQFSLNAREQGSTWSFSGVMAKSTLYPTDTVVIW